MSASEPHEQGLRLLHSGLPNEAVRCFAAALREQETSARWNDWATASLRCVRFADAEQGYRRALAIDPRNGQAALNLGVGLARQGRFGDAVAFLAQRRGTLKPELQGLFDSLLATCRARHGQAVPASILSAFGDRAVAAIFSDSAPVGIAEPALSWLNPPSPQFLAYVRDHERLPFDDIPPDPENFLKPPTFRIAQAHRIWITLETLRRHLPPGKNTAILDLGAFPFAIDLGIREFLNASCPIWASVHQTFPCEWSEWLGERNIHLTWTNLDPLVRPNEPISDMKDTIQARDTSMGLVIFAHVIEHLYQPLRILKEACRVLEPGGRILVSTANTFMAQSLLAFLSLGEYLHEPVEGTAAMAFRSWRGHVRFFSAGDLQKLLEAAGFEVVESQFYKVLYNSFVEEYFRQPVRTIPRWRAELLSCCPGYRNEIVSVGQKP
ncbi:MAG: methyltransferase domain-containing protein [Terriglobia bacterium]